MLFGSKDDFAIECYPPDGSGAAMECVYGRMCAWCGGERLGDIDENEFLFHVGQCIKGLVETLHKRMHEDVDGLSDSEAFEFLDAKLYSGRGSVPAVITSGFEEQADKDWQRFSGFNFLTNWGEQFDYVKGYLLNNGDGTLRVLYEKYNRWTRTWTMPMAVRATEQGLREAAAGFLAWLQEQERFKPSK